MIHPVIEATATRWGIDPALIQAMYLAEGGTEATFLKAVQCSLHTVDTFEKAIEVACRTATHWMWVYAKQNGAAAYINLLGAHWAPTGAANDPHGLNENWIPNVLRLWRVPPTSAST